MDKSYVYFIKNENNGLIKIGRTKNILSRFKAVSSKAKVATTLLGYIKTNIYCDVETTLHDEFKNLRITGEWFELSLLHIDSYISSDKFKEDMHRFVAIKTKREFWPYKIDFFNYRNHVNKLKEGWELSRIHDDEVLIYDMISKSDLINI